jgi:DNA segregation ATPase FtsK/SpoIIIE, S-DNA-T family
MAQNTYKKENKKKEEKEKEEKPQRSFKFKMEFLNDRKFHLFLGLFLILGAIFMGVSFISYLVTGRADQSVVESLGSAELQESGQEVENWFGILGAIVAHYFIFLWFGIASLLIPPFVFLVGHRVVWRRKLLSLVRTFAFTAFFLLWVSTLLGYFILVSDEISFWGFICGGVGYEVAIVLDSLMGWGTVLFLIFLFMIFNMYFFNITKLALVDDVVADLKNRLNIVDAEDENDEGKEDNEDSLEVSPISDLDDEGEEELKVEDLTEKEKDKSLDFLLSQIKKEVEEEEKKPEPIVENKLTESWKIEEKPKRKMAAEDLELSIEMPERPPVQQPIVQKPIVEDLEDEDEIDEKYDFGDLGMAVNVPTDGEVRVTQMENYDPTLDLPRYQYPGPDLLIDYPVKDIQVSKEELEQNKDKILETLINFKIGIASIKATIGPTVTLYEIVPEAGVKISKIKNLEDDIALSLSALGIRIIAPIPGKGTIGIEVPNKHKEMVDVKSVITTEKFGKSTMDLPIVLGKTISNEVFVTDLAKMPHLLMAGATGQGKSVGLNMIITSLIYKKHPSQLKFVMVDPKKVELTLFNKLERHFLAKLPDSDEAIITDTGKVVNTLNSLCIEMDQRYDLLKDAGCRNLKEYNKKFTSRRLNPQKGHRFLPYIVLIIDELADLMMTAGKEVEQPIARLAQLARAIGIHLIVATQRPSVNVITGIIKANFPARLSFRVTSKIDSRTILDAGGADQLIGQGDMLLSMGSEIIRLQCAFVDTPEVDRIVEFIGDQRGYDTAYLLPEFVGDDEGSSSIGSVDLSDRDVLFDDAARLIVLHQQGSTSLIQRKLKLGYNRAGRLIDQLEAAGIVGGFEGSKARDVLIQDEYALEQLLSSLGK